MLRRNLVASLMSAASVAVGGSGAFEAWRYRRMAIEAERVSEANAAELAALKKAEIDFAQQGQQLDQTRQQLAESHQEAREIITQLVGLSPEDSAKQIAYRLTDKLYQTNDGWGRDDHYSTALLTFVMTILGPASNLCSGLSQNLHWSLDQFAIPNRFIVFAAQTFLDGKQLGDTHELIEAKLDGHVIALDPTFSVTYCNGDDPTPIDARTIVDCAKGGTLRTRPIGKSRPGRAPSDYYLPIDKLAVAMQATGGGPDFYQQELPYPGWFAKTMTRYRKA